VAQVVGRLRNSVEDVVTAYARSPVAPSVVRNEILPIFKQVRRERRPLTSQHWNFAASLIAINGVPHHRIHSFDVYGGHGHVDQCALLTLPVCVDRRCPSWTSCPCSFSPLPMAPGSSPPLRTTHER
jgi:hypothetical protein